MILNKKRLTLDNFQQSHKKNQEQKLLEQALVYLKLREYGCPKIKALSFVKKKEKGTDGTIKMDGPAGFRKLKPQKPQRNLINGWVVGDKHKYVGLRGYSEEIIRNVSKEKQIISRFNQKDRKELEKLRLKQKHQRQGFLKIEDKKVVMEQISSMKDEFLKDREKRNLFLSYSGLRLEQVTRSYFQKIQELDPNSYIEKLAAFQAPLNDQNIKLQTDWEVAKGRSLSNYEIDGEKKRDQIMNFRRSLSSFHLPQGQFQDKFRKTMSFSSKKCMVASMPKMGKQKRMKDGRQFEKFNKEIQKILLIKKNKL